jgi:large subunit ribosomal protein L29
MKSAELRDLAVEELRERREELRKELFNLRFQSATGEIQNPMRIGAVRKDIARVLTVMNDKERNAKAGVEGRDV